MTDAPKMSRANPKPLFEEYDCVVVNKNPKNSKLLQADPEWAALKKGDKGAVVMVYDGQDGFSYELDVPKRGITVNIEENFLMADLALDAPNPQIKRSSASPQPPKMPEDLEQ